MFTSHCSHLLFGFPIWSQSFFNVFSHPIPIHLFISYHLAVFAVVACSTIIENVAHFFPKLILYSFVINIHQNILHNSHQRVASCFNMHIQHSSLSLYLHFSAWTHQFPKIRLLSYNSITSILFLLISQRTDLFFFPLFHLLIHGLCYLFVYIPSHTLPLCFSKIFFSKIFEKAL